MRNSIRGDFDNLPIEGEFSMRKFELNIALDSINAYLIAELKYNNWILADILDIGIKELNWKPRSRRKNKEEKMNELLTQHQQWLVEFSTGYNTPSTRTVDNNLLLYLSGLAEEIGEYIESQEKIQEKLELGDVIAYSLLFKNYIDINYPLESSILIDFKEESDGLGLAISKINGLMKKYFRGDKQDEDFKIKLHTLYLLVKEVIQLQLQNMKFDIEEIIKLNKEKLTCRHQNNALKGEGSDR